MTSTWEKIKKAFRDFQKGPYPGVKAYTKKKQAARKGPTLIPIFTQPAQKLPTQPAVKRPHRDVPKKFKPNKLLQPEVLPKKDTTKEAARSKGETKERQARGVGEERKTELERRAQRSSAAGRRGR